MNQAIHSVDLLLWLMGPAVQVTAHTATLAHERIEVEDVATATVRFASGALGVIEATTAAFPGSLKKIELSGTQGTAILEEENIIKWEFAKMSKRDEGASVSGYIEAGYLPAAVRNYLCLLGWSPKENREKLPIAEVIERFELGQINRKNAAFDLEKRTWLNAEYMRELPVAEFLAQGRAALGRAGIDLSAYPEAYVNAALETAVRRDPANWFWVHRRWKELKPRPEKRTPDAAVLGK